MDMEVVVERCAGLDVHQGSVVACIAAGPPGKRLSIKRKTFGTFTAELEQLRAWLVAEGVTCAVMESTGVYWKPVYSVLELAPSLELIVGNAQHIKNVPGRKTDMKDAEWLARLGRFGLVQKSFVPAPPQRALRDLVRARKNLVQEQGRVCNRVLKLLESANCKLGSVASDAFGLSGMAMLRALAKGETDPRALAALAQGNLKKKKALLELAFSAKLLDHHRFLLGLLLEQYDGLDRQLQQVEGELEKRLEPQGELMERLCEIPGVKWMVAASILAEMGTDLSVFGNNPARLAAWAGVCPGNNQSAGKRGKQGKRKGNLYLCTALVEAAQAAWRKKGSYFRNKFMRVKARRGHTRAILMLAHKLLGVVFHLMSTGERYRELGEGYLDGRQQERATKHLVKRLERLGHKVVLTPALPAQAPSAQAQA